MDKRNKETLVFNNGHIVKSSSLSIVPKHFDGNVVIMGSLDVKADCPAIYANLFVFGNITIQTYFKIYGDIFCEGFITPEFRNARIICNGDVFCKKSIFTNMEVSGDVNCKERIDSGIIIVGRSLNCDRHVHAKQIEIGDSVECEYLRTNDGKILGDFYCKKSPIIYNSLSVKGNVQTSGFRVISKEEN